MELWTLATVILIVGGLRWALQPVVHDDYEVVKAQRGHANPVLNAVQRGYQEISKVSGKPFWVEYWQKRYLILPLKYLPDVRRAHREHLRFTDSIRDVLFMYQWTGDLFESNRMTFAVMKGVNPRLPKLSNLMFREASFAFDQEIQQTDGEPTSYDALGLMTSIGLRIMTCVIAGQGLSRDQTFLDSIHGYFAGIFTTGSLILSIPFRGPLRDLLAWPLSKYHQYFRQQPIIDRIKPFVTRQMEDYRLGMHDPTAFTTIQATLDLLKQHPLDENMKHSPEQMLAHETLHLLWAGGQSPALSTTSILFKLLDHPSYIEPLREEARAAVDQHGWADPIFNELPKMDSFIRETHRVSPGFTLNVTRVIRGQPFTCSDGLTIPAGTRIAFPAESCQQDPDLIEDPTRFDGFRFWKLAAADAREDGGINRWAASHASASNLTFGYGNHVCPGRFIAIRLVKLMLSKILLEYDVSWDREDGEPPRAVMEGISFPNVAQKIKIQKLAKA